MEDRQQGRLNGERLECVAVLDLLTTPGFNIQPMGMLWVSNKYRISRLYLTHVLPGLPPGRPHPLLT